jgi:hypothetical protein
MTVQMESGTPTPLAPTPLTPEDRAAFAVGHLRGTRMDLRYLCPVCRSWAVLGHPHAPTAVSP